MCKLLVNAVDKPGYKRGDVIGVMEDKDFEGNIPRNSSKWRIVNVSGIPVSHPSITKLLMRDELGSSLAPARTFYIDLDALEHHAFTKTGLVGSSDMAIRTGLVQIEAFTKIRFIPHTNAVIG